MMQPDEASVVQGPDVRDHGPEDGAGPGDGPAGAGPGDGPGDGPDGDGPGAGEPFGTSGLGKLDASYVKSKRVTQ
jgi:hypothetical protein